MELIRVLLIYVRGLNETLKLTVVWILHLLLLIYCILNKISFDNTYSLFLWILSICGSVFYGAFLLYCVEDDLSERYNNWLNKDLNIEIKSCNNCKYSYYKHSSHYSCRKHNFDIDNSSQRLKEFTCNSWKRRIDYVEVSKRKVNFRKIK